MPMTHERQKSSRWRCGNEGSNEGVSNSVVGDHVSALHGLHGGGIHAHREKLSEVIHHRDLMRQYGSSSLDAKYSPVGELTIDILLRSLLGPSGYGRLIPCPNSILFCSVSTSRIHRLGNDILRPFPR